jgi:protein-S-isoprenylcysteine O-methyltransferase Ste14
MTLWIFFTAGTVLLAVFTWVVSLRARRLHGIARFFAFDAILALFLLNVPFWFRRPWSPFQILSWVALFASLGLAIHGAVILHKRGRPEGQFENTTRLVVQGAYKFIRHPMYESVALLGLGIFLKNVTPLTTVLVLVVLVAAYLTAKIEEREMLAKFGEDYRVYLRTTKMFVPYLW